MLGNFPFAQCGHDAGGVGLQPVCCAVRGTRVETFAAQGCTDEQLIVARHEIALSAPDDAFGKSICIGRRERDHLAFHGNDRRHRVRRQRVDARRPGARRQYEGVTVIRRKRADRARHAIFGNSKANDSLVREQFSTGPNECGRECRAKRTIVDLRFAGIVKRTHNVRREQRLEFARLSRR
jgi:hypothetical protein